MLGCERVCSLNNIVFGEPKFVGALISFHNFESTGPFRLKMKLHFQTSIIDIRIIHQIFCKENIKLVSDGKVRLMWKQSHFSKRHILP